MRLALLLAFLLACLLSGMGPAHAGRLVELSVVDRDTGQHLPVHWHGGEAWIAGTPGHRYAVRLANRSGQRVLAVLSVDGVNAVTGEDAAGDQAGYVLAPWGSTEVTGWRKSLSEVAAFEFTSLGDSYAARTGRPGNVGVIGVAVFEERRRRAWRDEDRIGGAQEREGSARHDERALARQAPAPQAADAASAEAKAWAGAPAEPLGTGHGQREWSTVRRTGFERASRHPAEVLSLRYDSYANLAAAGIVPRRWPRYGQHRDPQPFPGGFVPDP